MTNRLIYILLLLVSPLTVLSQTVQTQASGDWSSASTWVGGAVPAATDNVVVRNGHTVRVDLPSAGSTVTLCHGLTVEQEGVLRLGYDGADTDKRFGLTGDLVCHGTIAAGREVPADFSSGQGLIYANNSSLVFQLTQPTTSISGTGYLHPADLIITNQTTARTVHLDHYNVLTDGDFVVLGQATVDLTLGKYAYLHVGGTLGITGGAYAESPTDVAANVTVEGLVMAQDVSLFTKNGAEGSSLTLAPEGVVTAHQINNGQTVSSAAGGFLLELQERAIWRCGAGVSSPQDLAAADAHLTVTNTGGDVKLHYENRLTPGATVASEVQGFSGGVTLDGTPLRDVLGASHIAGWYNFTEQSFLLEGRDRFKEWGSRNIKTTISADNGKMYSAYPFNTDWPTFDEMSEVINHPEVAEVFNDPYFTRHAFWAPSKGVNGFYKRGPDRNHHRYIEAEEQNYRAAKAILTNHGSLGKIFLFQNWEGDWMLRGSNRQWEQDPSSVPDDIDWQVEGMARMWRAHMRGIERAVAEHPEATSQLQYAVEFNKLFYNQGGTRRTMMELGLPSVLGDVIPRVRMHLSSWSAYDGNFDEPGTRPFPTGMWNGMEIADYFTNDTKGLDGVPVQIGEIGLNENPPYQGLSDGAILDRYDKMVAMVAKLGVQNLYMWNLYGSGQQGVELDKGVQYETEYLYQVLDGKWVIEPGNVFGLAGGHLMNNYFMLDAVAPTVLTPIGDQALHVGFASKSFDLTESFFDGNGDPLTFTATSDDETVVTVAVESGQLVLTEQGLGTANVTVTASDGLDQASQTFSVNVAEAEVFIGATFYDNISAALDAAVAGDVIEIRGVHTEPITITKAVTLRGLDPRFDKIQAAQSLGQSSSRVVLIERPEGSTQDLNVTLENLGIRHGQATENGGGIFADKLQGLLTLRNLIVEHNATDRNGGGVSVAGSSLDMIDCSVLENTSAQDGGGLIVAPNNAVTTDSQVRIIRCLFHLNTGRNGGGIYINGNKDFGDTHLLDVYLENTTLVSNAASSAGSGAGGGAIWSRSALWKGNNTSGNVSLSLVHATLVDNTHASAAKNGIQFSTTDAGAETQFSMYNSLAVAADDLTQAAVNFTGSTVAEVKNTVLGTVNGAPAWLGDAAHNNIVNRDLSETGLTPIPTDEGGAVQMLALPESSFAVDHCTAAVSVTLPTRDGRGSNRDEVPDAGAYEFVPANLPPEVVSNITNQNLAEGYGSWSVSLAGRFSDPDGDAMTYTALVSHPDVLTVAVDGETLTLSEVSPGSALITVVADDGEGHRTSFAFEVEVTARPLSLQPQGTLGVYPNPAREELFFSTPSEVQSAQLVDLSGRTVRVQLDRVPGSYRLDVSAAPQGVYLLVVTTAEGSFTGRILIAP